MIDIHVVPVNSALGPLRIWRITAEGYRGTAFLPLTVETDAARDQVRTKLRKIAVSVAKRTGNHVLAKHVESALLDCAAREYGGSRGGMVDGHL